MTHPAAPFEWKTSFNRGRQSPKHIDQCSSGYRRQGKCQVHHLLCVHSCADAGMPPEHIDSIHEFMVTAEWDINDAHNTIGLPIKPAYHEALGEAKTSRSAECVGDSSALRGKPPPGWDGLPCHQVDHNPTHTTEVVNWVKTNVWSKLLLAKKKKKCDRTAADKIETMLEAGSDHFRKQLEARGKRGPKGSSTAAMIESGYASDTWYLPFSMAESGTAMKRPRPRARPSHELNALLIKTIF